MKAKSSLPVRRGLQHNALGTNQFAANLAGEVGFVLAVDQRRVAAPIVDFSLDAKALRLSVGDFGNALLQQAAHLRIERARTLSSIYALCPG